MLKIHSFRFTAALKAAGIHLLVSIGIALCCAAFIFSVWYPAPFDQLANGRSLILLIITVDVVCGPLLTSIVYNPLKPKAELRRDLVLIALLQLGALGYGFYSAMQARPVWLAFEGDRFRVVSIPDIDLENLSDAPTALRDLSFTGPKLLGVRLIDGNNPAFAESVVLSAQGFHPAFRPSRWLPYAVQANKVVLVAKPLSLLSMHDAKDKNILNKAVRISGVEIAKMGYLPLATNDFKNWAVVVNLDTAEPVFYLPIDAW